MEKIALFNYSAIAVLFCIISTAYFRKMGSANGNRAFIAVVLEMFITSIFDSFAVYFDNLGVGNVFFKYFTHSGYLVFHTMSSLFYVIYIISLTDTWHQLFKKPIRLFNFSIPMVLYLLCYIPGIFGGPAVFYINENDIYTRGPLFLANYITAAIYLVYGVYHILKNRKLFSVKWILTLFSPYPFILVAMIVEYFMPSIIIEMFFNSLAMLFIYCNIQRPDELMDHHTGLGNLVSFENSCKRIFHSGKNVTVIMLRIANYSNIISYLDYNDGNLFRKCLGNDMKEINKISKIDAAMFHGNGGRFYIIINENKHKYVDNAAKMLLKRFNSPKTFSGTEVSPISGLCVIDIPKDIPSLDSLMSLCNGDMFNIEKAEIILAKDLFEEKKQRILLDIDRVIANALDNNRLEVYYQPIFSLKEKRFISAEALIRLKDPEYGFVPPDWFIPASEKNGFINNIWEFVLNSVCQFIASKEFKNLGLEYIEVNLSAAQCMQTDLAKNILDTIDYYGINYSTISPEITETAISRSPDMLLNNIEKLSNAGMHVCLDDYGTGYSNIKRLIDLPISITKLDKTFIDNFNETKNNILIKDMIHLLKSVDMGIVAEGVETEEILVKLKEFDCDYIQGYYFSKPLPKDEFCEFLKNFDRSTIEKIL